MNILSACSQILYYRAKRGFDVLSGSRTLHKGARLFVESSCCQEPSKEMDSNSADLQWQAILINSNYIIKGVGWASGERSLGLRWGAGNTPETKPGSGGGFVLT